MTKSNIHKKMTYEDKFDRKYACWANTHKAAWHKDKLRNRRLFRRRMLRCLINEYEGEIKE